MWLTSQWFLLVHLQSQPDEQPGSSSQPQSQPSQSLLGQPLAPVPEEGAECLKCNTFAELQERLDCIDGSEEVTETFVFILLYNKMYLKNLWGYFFFFFEKLSFVLFLINLISSSPFMLINQHVLLEITWIIFRWKNNNYSVLSCRWPNFLLKRFQPPNKQKNRNHVIPPLFQALLSVLYPQKRWMQK